MNRRRMLGILGAVTVAAAHAARRSAAAERPTIRIGILQFGSVAWQLDVVRRHGLAEAEGIAIEPVILAANQATLVALQAGSVEIIVSDLLWLARQRAGGADWSFRPYSTALGAVEVPAESPIRSLADLPGRRLGIAGTALDKSWLLLRLLARKQNGRDLDEVVEKSFGAPPLLAEQLAAGRLDAVLTYWQFAARLEARGARRLLGMGEAMRALGIAEPVPLAGYVLSACRARGRGRELADDRGGRRRSSRRAGARRASPSARRDTRPRPRRFHHRHGARQRVRIGYGALARSRPPLRWLGRVVAQSAGPGHRGACLCLVLPHRFGVDLRRRRQHASLRRHADSLSRAAVRRRPLAL